MLSKYYIIWFWQPLFVMPIIAQSFLKFTANIEWQSRKKILKSLKVKTHRAFNFSNYIKIVLS